jgi:hypothetical protein
MSSLYLRYIFEVSQRGEYMLASTSTRVLIVERQRKRRIYNQRHYSDHQERG